jgi:hypothetical protein
MMSLFEMMTNATTIKQAWEILQQLNKEADSVRKISLKKLRGDFEKLCMLKL